MSKPRFKHESHIGYCNYRRLGNSVTIMTIL
ncbi:hypothetical protein M6B38_127010 [Iris pallida]|uniref:Uncharacterized protein n=1 Tax=Iris pallida TaxID=29817 RepID=A0AAX6GFI5_IRIPA|nr:hypothetical protein M6B38_127010 [Iris pallida]